MGTTFGAHFFSMYTLVFCYNFVGLFFFTTLLLKNCPKFVQPSIIQQAQSNARTFAKYVFKHGSNFLFNLLMWSPLLMRHLSDHFLWSIFQSSFTHYKLQLHVGPIIVCISIRRKTARTIIYQEVCQ